MGTRGSWESQVCEHERTLAGDPDYPLTPWDGGETGLEAPRGNVQGHLSSSSYVL